MGLQRLVENFSITKDDAIPFTTEMKEGVGTPLTENVQGLSYPCIARYRVPVSKINTFQEKNLNGRVYGVELWENVYANQKHIWEGGVGLADHPEDDSDGSVRDVFCVWHNLGINKNKGIIEADLHLVGPYGKLAEEVLAAGGRLGFSSSGFGELQEDGATVDPKTYMLERVSDWVLTPSQQVYGTSDMKLKQESATNYKENTNNPIKEDKKEAMAESKISKLEERKFRRDVETFLQEANTLKDPKEKLESLKEIHSYFAEGVADDLRTQVEKEMALTEERIKTILKEHVKLEEDFGISTVDELKEGVSRIAVDRKISESQSRDWKKVSESLQAKIKKLQETIDSYPTPEAYENALAFNRKVRISYLEKKKDLQDQFSKLNEQLEGQTAVGAKLKELADSAVAAKKLAERKYADLNKKLEESQKETAAVAAKLAESEKLRARLIEKYESAPRLEPRKTPIATEFTEKADVEKYYKDLVSRHGKVITPYKERLLRCKTLKEAMYLYTKILPTIDEVQILPESVRPEIRENYLRETTGGIVKPRVSLKKPDGWV